MTHLTSIFRPLAALLLAPLLLGGCATLGLDENVDDDVVLAKPLGEIPEPQLLDLWIELFDPGQLPDDEEDRAGLSLEIRDAEARFVPQHLRDTAEQTGYWGAVRVVPQGNSGGEVVVKGTILASDGERLEIAVQAGDATGRTWFEKEYVSILEPRDHDQARRGRYEPFQPLYNSVVNDLAAFRNELAAEELVAIRRTASLRFAADLAPDPFATYLTEDLTGRVQVLRLPAADDPMFQRIRAIRERDYQLLDTLNAHFDNFYRQMRPPYDEWRRARSAEAEALRTVEREALQRKLLGLAAILGAIAVQATSNSNNYPANSVARDVLVLGGVYAVKSGFDMDSETVIHRDAISELGDSFTEEAQPLVVEVEGETHRLTGSAEAQYAQWRELLRRIYAAETGLAPPAPAQ